MRRDRITGKLTGPQMTWMHLILGEVDGFSYAMDGESVEFIALGKHKIGVEIEDGRAVIEVALNLSALGGQGADDARIADRIKDEIAGTIAYCQSIPADPFGFFEIATRGRLSKREWREGNWLAYFQAADVRVKLNILALGT
ncbi:MAG: Ger(x)C family spore germination C-terminal domain-containing protein [Christensenellales bacterium]|jgi:hypothetical protein